MANLRGTDWSASSNGGLDGWVVGGGIEYHVGPSWSVKAEYLYFDFNHANRMTGLTFNFERDLTVNSFKVGINYHFNNVYAPLK